MSDPIVVGVDGSEDCLRAVKYASGTALMMDRDLFLVNAVDDTLMAGAWGVVYDAEALQEAGKAANALAKEHALSHGMPEDRIHTECVMGTPGGVLTRLSEQAALIVVGRRAASGLERMFVGSTSVAVVANASCPVVVISAASTPYDVGGKRLIGVGVNAQPGSSKTLRAGFEQAKLHESKLEIVHVIQPNTGFFSHRLSPEQLNQQIMFAQGGIEALTKPLSQEFPDVEYEISVVADSPINEFVSRSAHYDLLVIGVTNSPIPGMQLGGLMRGLMAHAHCPLYIAE